MNANELADELDYCYRKEYPCPVSKEAATMLRQQEVEIERITSKHEEMLRQQQAEIEALKQIIDANNLNQNIGQFVKPIKYSDAWWREVDEFNKQLKAQEK